jgi:hypothetical protein
MIGPRCGGSGGEKASLLFFRQDALLDVALLGILFDLDDGILRGEPPGDSQVEHDLEKRRLAVRRGLADGSQPLVPILFNHERRDLLKP